MEARFIDFCHALPARPSVIDCLIWDQMRTYGKLALDALNVKFNPEKTAKFPQQKSQIQMHLSA